MVIVEKFVEWRLAGEQKYSEKTCPSEAKTRNYYKRRYYILSTQHELWSASRSFPYNNNLYSVGTSSFMTLVCFMIMAGTCSPWRFYLLNNLISYTWWASDFYTSLDNVKHMVTAKLLPVKAHSRDKEHRGNNRITSISMQWSVKTPSQQRGSGVFCRSASRLYNEDHCTIYLFE
jgi:hypothetical protein